jgi:hypothetical protein
MYPKVYGVSLYGVETRQAKKAENKYKMHKYVKGIARLKFTITD